MLRGDVMHTPDDWLHVTVVYCPAPRQVQAVLVRLPAGSTIQQAIQASGLLVRCPDLKLAEAKVGVWGVKADLNRTLNDLDRVEIYRPLQVDPKFARRERFKKQGVRTTGLFTRS